MFRKKKSVTSTPTVFTKQELDSFFDKYTAEEVPVARFEKDQKGKVTRDQRGKVLRKTMTEATKKNKIKTKSLTTGKVNQFGFISSISESFQDGFKHARYEKDPVWEYVNSDLLPTGEPEQKKIINHEIEVEEDQQEEQLEAEKTSSKLKEPKSAIYNILPEDGKILKIAEVGLKNARSFKSTIPKRPSLRKVLTEVDVGIYERGEKFDFLDSVKNSVKSLEKVSSEHYPGIIIVTPQSESARNNILIDPATTDRKKLFSRNSVSITMDRKKLIEPIAQRKSFSYFTEVEPLLPEKETHTILTPIVEDRHTMPQRLTKLDLGFKNGKYPITKGRLSKDFIPKIPRDLLNIESQIPQIETIPKEVFHKNSTVVRPMAPNPFNSDCQLVNENKDDYSLIDWMKMVNSYKKPSGNIKPQWLPINIGAVAEFGKTVYQKELLSTPEFKDPSTFKESTIVTREIRIPIKENDKKLMIACPNLPIKLNNRFWNTGF
jgi:hypothetical protein